MDKLGLYISNLMTTIVDKEEKHFVRKLAFDQLRKLMMRVGSMKQQMISILISN